MDTKKLTIICITLIALVGIGTFTFLSLNLNNNEITYVKENYDGFSMNVPNGTLFKKVNLDPYGMQEELSDGEDYLKIKAYKNKGNYSENLTGVFFLKSSIQFGFDNFTGDSEDASETQMTALLDYLFPMGEKIREEGEIYVNTSDTKIVGGNTTSGPFYLGVLSDNEHSMLVTGGNNLDMVKNATLSAEFID